MMKIPRIPGLLAIAGLTYGLWFDPAIAQVPERVPADTAAVQEVEGVLPPVDEPVPGEAPAAEDPEAPSADATGAALVISDAMVEKLSGDQLNKLLLTAARKGQESQDVEALVIPIFFFALMAFVVAVPLYLGYRRDGLRQQTLRLMVEKGAEIPTELLTPPVKRRRSDLRTGLLLISTGLGLTVFLVAVSTADSPGLWAVGAVPVLLGCGYLAAWKLERGAET